MRILSGALGLALLLSLTTAAAQGEKSGIDPDGFIQRWLVLAPIPLAADQSGEDALDKEQVKDEAKLKPKAGAKVKVGGKELAWKEHTCKEHAIDFNALLGKETIDSVGYAVSYVVAPGEMKGVKMKLGSDDQVKVYLNGKEVHKNATARPLEKDEDSAEVTLKKGVNVLVVKVINEKVEWGLCVRFLGKDDKPLKLTAKTAE